MVNFSMRCNKNKNLRYASLQGNTGKALREQFNIPASIDSLIFIENGKASIYSSAALGICKHFSYPAKLLYIFILIPAFIRDPLYKWIASNRYKWFGKSKTCRIPSQKEKDFFLE